ncbi:DUF4870 domain-containing protein [Methanobrevibacter sp.]|uniref:DUF4870 domain-containing protein n=1 Tax=Methanobrevibacter sp. TaxID=66852 RepID=UPI0038709EB6
MAETKELVIVIVGYLVSLVSPLIGAIIGAVLFFTQKENPFYNKHGKYIIIFAIAVWIISIILITAGLLPSLF